MKITIPLISTIALGTAVVSAFPTNFNPSLLATRGEELAAIIRAAKEADPEILEKRATKLSLAVQAATATNYSQFAAFNKRVLAGGSTKPAAKRGGRTLTALIDPSNFKFNLTEQTVDLTSATHKFIAPGDDDIRGPCPGLNLLANHGYLNRNGVTDLYQGIDAINKVFGVGPDLALALNAYAVLFNGNPVDLTWSIGGPYRSKSLGAVTELLAGQPQGINAHNIYEGDASIVRQDYYAPAANHDNVNLHLPFFKQLLKEGGDSTPNVDVWTPDVMLQHKSNRWHDSVATNPLFFNSAFGGLVVTTAAERFVAEFAANNSADSLGYNRIYLDEPNLLAFFGVTKSKSGKLTYTVGHERLLPTWKRRPLAANFGLDDIAVTLLSAAAIDPSLLSVGGNNGKVNTFTGLDAGNITGGVYNTAGLLQNPQALACYLYQTGVEQLVPTQLTLIYDLVGDVASIVGSLLKAFQAPHANLATGGGRNPCDKYNSSIKEAYASYPGSGFVITKKGGIL